MSKNVRNIILGFMFSILLTSCSNIDLTNPNTYDTATYKNTDVVFVDAMNFSVQDMETENGEISFHKGIWEGKWMCEHNKNYFLNDDEYKVTYYIQCEMGFNNSEIWTLGYDFIYNKRDDTLKTVDGYISYGDGEILEKGLDETESEIMESIEAYLDNRDN